MKKVLFSIVVLTLLNSCLLAQTSLLATSSFNPDFETGTLSLWATTTSSASGAAATIVATTTTPQSGTTCAQVTVTSLPSPANAAALQLRTSNYFAVAANTSYTFRFWAKTDVAGNKINAYINNSSSVRPATRTGMDNVTLTTSWAQYTVTFSDPTGGNYRPVFHLAHNTGVFQIDNLEVFETASLPVELTKFDVKTNQTAALLTWTTASEKDNAEFQIERSNNGTTFTSIGTVKGSGTTNTEHTYNFNDETPLSMGYYRLRQIDFNGTSTVSKVVSVARDKGGLARFYPSVTKGELTIEVPNNAPTSISISDLTGRTVTTKTMTGTEKVDVSELSNGTYFLTITNGGVRITEKFVKQ